MTDESLPRRWGRFLPSKARVVQQAVAAAFPSRSERHQAEAGRASAAEALRSSEDIEAFGGVDEEKAEGKRRPGKKSKAPSSRDVEHSGFVGAQADMESGIGMGSGLGPDGEIYEHEIRVEGEPTPIEQTLEAGEQLEPDPTAAAFFDVDNTLIQGASILLLARGLARHKFFTTQDVATMIWQQAKFRVSGRESMSDVASGREKALSFVKGRKVREVEELSMAIFDESIADRFWPGTKALAQMHIDAGQQVWLVTATPVELANVIAERLGLTGALGTVAEREDGTYTGRLVGDILHGSGKAHAVKELARTKGLDLSKCYAYSDSSNDLPMLSLVAHPVAVNPDTALRDAARENGWQIKDYRTMRRAAKIGLQGTAVAAAAGGAVAVWRRRS